MTLNISEMSIPEQILFGGFFLGLLGETGCGKTTTLTYYLYWIHERLKEQNLLNKIGLYTNYDLIDIPEEGLKWNYTRMKHPDELMDIKVGFCGVDELWRWCLDSYNSQKSAVKGYDDISANARKSGIGFIASSQRFMRIDPNFRANVHYVIFPSMFYDMYNRPYRIGVIVANNQTGELEDRFSFDPNPVFRMFKTEQKIKRVDSTIQVGLEELAKEFDKWNTVYQPSASGEKIPIAKQQVSQPVVDLFLVDKGLYNRMTKNERKMVLTQIKRIGL